MAKKGYIIESKLSAKDVGALKLSAVATTDVDGGTLVSVAGINSDGLYVATKATSGAGLYMAYNPSEHLTAVDGNFYAGLSKDPRDYTNIANRPMDLAKLVVGDRVTLTAGNIKTADVASVAVGKFLEQGSTGYEVKDSATASTTSLEVLAVNEIPFPQKGIGMEFAKGYFCRVAQN